MSSKKRQIDVVIRNDGGRQFHRRGPATEKLLRLEHVRVLGNRTSWH